ncbi:MAG: alpha/beta hydrolase [Deltaproteobacteria bacterium]|nr:alpha/beta hydrolase [Deltaproteobacteria bacterium]
MKIDFSYKKRNIISNSGYIFKGKHYRCSYIRFPTLYEKPEAGTETVELYNFQPKSKIRASLMILHGLGSSNIKFLLWMGKQLASAGINTSVLILPGIYTRVENGSASGVSYLHPHIPRMYNIWEHAVVDTLSIIDFLEQKKLWKKNNCLLGYCLGGMLASIVSVLDTRVQQTIFMTIGGHLPRILFESRTTLFVRKIIQAGFKNEYYLHDKKRLYTIYKEQLPSVKKMSLHEILNNEEIHPLFRIDPLSYTHLLDKSKIAFIDALFDRSLPFQSRRLLYKEMAGTERYIIPIGHVSWLPFEYLLARYITYKVHIYDRNVAKRLIMREMIEDPLDDFLE